ncbi:helix-turn-helix domain-containing protein [Gallibacterium melopsittaci]|uniref:Helix-turn-helix domain-containing protein n=1 Tax=Gallibacterium melopsittaci TaxID=516063 RepID=A0ABV6HT36_9PAST|nr:helix-turn-helix domain-containing protein [Gallibacterium anatis]KGQ25840.1 Cro/Cl family transcriptional regulator [Gallibacterium anatis]
MNKKLKSFIDKFGGQSYLAKACDVSQPTVFKWVNGRKMDVKYIPKIIEISNGEVTARDLRPDVDWDTIKASL